MFGRSYYNAKLKDNVGLEMGSVIKNGTNG